MTDSSTKRRIGDILLQLGFASEAALARAAAEQEQTGQPLGQILVEHGVITRLELASALAEQWSDNASIAPLPVPAAMPPMTAQPHDDDQYAARLQEAVAELAQRVDASRPDEGVDSRVTELAERVEATVARTQRLEATIATLAESFDGVTSGVEDAFGVLQSGMAGLALDLARLDTTVTALRAESAVTPVDTSHVEQHVEELRLAVQQLAERPLVDEDARRRADDLAAAVNGLADGEALESVRSALRGLQQRMEELGAEDGPAAELESQRALLAELRWAVAELQDRPTGDPGLDARLSRIETQLADLSSRAPEATDVEAIAGRLEKTRDAHHDLARSVDKLARRLDELVKRKAGDAAPSAEVEALRVRLADLGAELAEVRAAVPTGRVEELSERLERLAADDGQRQLESRLHELENGYVTGDELAHALEQAREELRPVPAAPDPRIAVLTESLDALRDDLARVSASPVEDPTARAELALLTDRVEQLVSRDELARAVTDAGANPGAAAVAPDPRVDRLVHDLDVLRSEVARIEPLLGPDPDVAARLNSLAASVDEITRGRQVTEALRLELEERLGAAVTHDELRTALAHAREELASQPTPAPDPRIERLASELEALRHDLGRAADTPSDAVADAHEQIRALAARLAGLEALGARFDQLAETVAAPMPLDNGPVDQLRNELDGRLAELARMLEEQVANGSQAATPGSLGIDEGIEEELERTRMAIERLSLHLGEHDRALVEMRGSRAMTQRLEELSARLEELAANGAPASPGSASPGESSYTRRSIEPDIEMRSVLRRLEDLEEASSVGREKLMNRLERMASSIDWRLRRLEEADQETP